MVGRTAAGLITTGVRRDRIAPIYQPVLAAAVATIRLTEPSASIAVYGSVATGQARPPGSDVDLVAVGLPGSTARTISGDLTGRYRGLCRGVAVGAYPQEHLVDESDAAYGDRVFLRHYCVHLAGPDHARGWSPFPADRRAARGFNGDIAACAERWRRALDTDPPDRLGRAVARKTLLAVSGLVSVHDQTWTTDRGTAARRWGEFQPHAAEGLNTLLSWSDGRSVPVRSDVGRALAGIVDQVVHAFADLIGTWP
jgi:hypothetical protein